MSAQESDISDDMPYLERQSPPRRLNDVQPLEASISKPPVPVDPIVDLYGAFEDPDPFDLDMDQYMLLRNKAPHLNYDRTNLQDQIAMVAQCLKGWEREKAVKTKGSFETFAEFMKRHGETTLKPLAKTRIWLTAIDGIINFQRAHPTIKMLDQKDLSTNAKELIQLAVDVYVNRPVDKPFHQEERKVRHRRAFVELQNVFAGLEPSNIPPNPASKPPPIFVPCLFYL